MKSNHSISFTILSFFIAAISLMTLSACETVVVQGGGGTSSGGGGYVYVDPYRHAWFDVYGNQCTSNGYPMAGCNFYSDGSKITSSGDPYYSNLTLYFDYWTYTDSYGYRRDYQGYAWLSNTGILYDQYGNALNELDETEQSADVISLAAQKEGKAAEHAGKVLSQKYALAEAAGVSIAKTLQDWAVIGRDRARTKNDVADFSKRLYGVELGRATRAIQDAAKGDRSALTELNIDVAAHWGTSPETSKEILSHWYKDELARVGVK
jgi:hypothetical protein